MSEVILLGPQRKRPTAPASVRGLEAPVASITAGWQENENDSLPGDLDGKSSNLQIYRRAEQVFDRDPELAEAHRERQLRLKELQRLYRLRLDHAMAAYSELMSTRGDDELVVSERGAALEALRALDRHHLGRVRAVHDEFESLWRPVSRPAVAAQRRELEQELSEVRTVIIAGGHVAVLLNRLRLFDMAPLLRDKTLVAWAAGAMVIAHRIVLFHDSPPWGAGNAEVLDAGLALYDDVLPLPDVERRLRTDDARRVQRLARRFTPVPCVGLGERSRLWRREGGWQGRRAFRLGIGGEVRQVGARAWEALAP